MNFTSIIFLFLFFPLCVVFYYFLFPFKKTNLKLDARLQNGVLLLFSAGFIAWISPKFLFIAIFIILVNYFGTIIMVFNNTPQNHRTSWQTIIFIGLLIFNICILGFYKYLPNLNAINLSWLSSVEWIDLNLLHMLILPLGISFYTFSIISYVADVFSGKIDVERNLFHFSVYVLFFPKFVSGPIERYETFAPQLKERKFSLSQIYQGMIRFIGGVCKKVLIVNTLSEATRMVFELSPVEWNFPLVWGGIFLYSLQIFLDFDAYSDMAIGLGKMFGFELMENFNFPYLATSIQEFWQRWHISLSTWLQDYLLMPFRFKFRRKKPAWVFSVLGILLTFLISGLWHGNSWNFALWGLWHGVFLSFEALFLKNFLGNIPIWLQRGYAFFVVMIGWVFFRLGSLNLISAYLSNMFIPQSFEGILYRGILEFSRIDLVLTIGFSILISLGVFKKIRKWTENKGLLFEFGYIFILFIFFGLSLMKLYIGYFQPFLYAQF